NKPPGMFDRDREWGALSRFALDDQPGATLGVVSGRRRLGKTYLLDGLCRATGGFYFGATESYGSRVTATDRGGTGRLHEGTPAVTPAELVRGGRRAAGARPGTPDTGSTG